MAAEGAAAEITLDTRVRNVDRGAPWHRAVTRLCAKQTLGMVAHFFVRGRHEALLDKHDEFYDEAIRVLSQAIKVAEDAEPDPTWAQQFSYWSYTGRSLLKDIASGYEAKPGRKALRCY
mmetsp:Transcript_17580/g.61825  ORF Transcript_17580/g.61825 Transcript_17580/m.61825 type:complete len:119 (-) Transcript_17580:54-410(-)